MFSATGGINTHKGLVFASAILCGALGKVHAGQELPPPLEDVLQECRKLGECSLADLHRLPNVQTPLPGSEIQNISRHTPDKMQSDLQSASAPDVRTHFVSLSTNGERIFTAYGIQGARGEAAAGFPSAVQIGLPSLKKWLFSGFSLNDAAAMALLTLISEVDDTNMVHRGGPELAKKSKEQAKRLLFTVTKENVKETLNSLDHQYITDNLSPGRLRRPSRRQPDVLFSGICRYDCGYLRWSKGAAHAAWGPLLSTLPVISSKYVRPTASTVGSFF